MRHRIRPISSRLMQFVQEGIALPLCAVAASFGFGLLALLAAGGSTGGGTLATAAAAGLGTATVIAARLLDLPRFLLPVEAALLVTAGRLFGGGWTSTVVLVASWSAAVHLGAVCVPLIGVTGLRPGDPEVRERLAQARREEDVYARSRVLWARQAAWRRSARLLVAATAAFTVRTGIDAALSGGSGPAPTWTGAGVLFGASLLVFHGLAQLLALRRLWRLDPSLHVPGAVGASWARFALAGAVVVVTAAWILPADVSPLLHVDWQTAMDRLVTAVFGKDGWLRTPERTLAPGGEGAALPRAQGGGPAGALEALWGLLILVGPVALLLWVVWKILEDALPAERARWRGFGQVLRAMLLAPFHFLTVLVRRLAVRRGTGRSTVGSGRRQAASVRAPGPDGRREGAAVGIRELFAWLLDWAAAQGHRRSADQTAREFAAALAAQWPERATDVASVAEAYQIARYSARTVPDSLVATVRTACRRITGVEPAARLRRRTGRR